MPISSWEKWKQRDAQVEAELSAYRIDNEDEHTKRLAAEAALAERVELRCTSCDDESECSILTAVCEHSDWEIEDGYQFGCRLHTDLRARAEEGSRDA